MNAILLVMSMITNSYPGTPRQWTVFAAIANHYAGDPRIRAVSVFGSLGCGTWDRFSDLDLDVVIADDARIDVRQELEQLCDRLEETGERPLLITLDEGADAGDVVLASLLELSIRYHPLHNTSPNIVDSLFVLTSRIDRQTIVNAGRSQRRPNRPSPLRLLELCLRNILGVDVALQRGELWRAVQMLDLTRGRLLDLFALARGDVRGYHSFQAKADTALQTRLGRTLPASSLESLCQALNVLLDILEHDLDYFAAGQVTLTEAHRELLERVRTRSGEA
ncbi:MAG: hypothetical protein ACR2PL_21355 [Dehalococcoidia bacterium]